MITFNTRKNSRLYKILKHINKSFIRHNSFLSNYWLSKRHITRACNNHAHLVAGNVLDFGCGTMPYKTIFANCNRYTPLEYDSTLRPGETRTESGVTYYDGSKLPFPSNYFDSVVSFQVLEHVEDIHLTLSELRRVAKPSALMLISLPFLWPEHEIPNDFRRYTEWGLRSILSDCQLECVSIWRLGSIYDILALLIIDNLNTRPSTLLRILAQLAAPILNLFALTLGFLDHSTSRPNRPLYLDLFVVARIK